ncbi:hypothetical protein EDB84DRAFT_1481121 [Lactarius hengduanensis]|nr:hypothetical protein EDB84DRAFT_1552034 [Lactarius hengduanensis]KAH9010832.1 hypothetical protein EDB85DRAFT_1177482 [Lactarius pseudohatsudake]KAH9013385.1 hypothetical protein EDB85DRAFT_969000 [Lactarius pseudohatsudake]KAH9014380.1 hypothetical protein EDB84DRAFT_1529770 [Lactarius hengduanensis]KAH9025777.1 hypothetical protein EDB84DRAFT_1503944 [Lactarius hengduanensis]
MPCRRHCRCLHHCAAAADLAPLVSLLSASGVGGRVVGIVAVLPLSLPSAVGLHAACTRRVLRVATAWRWSWAFLRRSGGGGLACGEDSRQRRRRGSVTSVRNDMKRIKKELILVYWAEDQLIASRVFTLVIGSVLLPSSSLLWSSSPCVVAVVVAVAVIDWWSFCHPCRRMVVVIGHRLRRGCLRCVVVIAALPSSSLECRVGVALRWDLFAAMAQRRAAELSYGGWRGDGSCTDEAAVADFRGEGWRRRLRVSVWRCGGGRDLTGETAQEVLLAYAGRRRFEVRRGRNGLQR